MIFGYKYLFSNKVCTNVFANKVLSFHMVDVRVSISAAEAKITYLCL